MLVPANTMPQQLNELPYWILTSTSIIRLSIKYLNIESNKIAIANELRAISSFDSVPLSLSPSLSRHKNQLQTWFLNYACSHVFRLHKHTIIDIVRCAIFFPHIDWCCVMWTYPWSTPRESLYMHNNCAIILRRNYHRLKINHSKIVLLNHVMLLLP